MGFEMMKFLKLFYKSFAESRDNAAGRREHNLTGVKNV